MTRDEGRLIVVDAANVVGSRPDGWWRDRAGAARRLLEKLKVLPFRLEESADVTVVLEGAARAAVKSDEPDLQGVRVVLADGSGDDAIVGVVAAAVEEDNNRQITVVTADRGLRERVEAYGVTTVGPRWIWDRIDA